MAKNKHYYIILLTFIAGGLLGAFLGSSVLAKKPDVGTYEIQLQTLNGEPLHEYDWGVFALRETKTIECNLVYLGNEKVKATWNITDLQGWKIEIWDISESKPKLWEEGSYLSCKPRVTWKLRIIMSEVNAIQDEISMEDLNFYTLMPSNQ